MITLKQRFEISENKPASYKKYPKLSDIFLRDVKIWLKQKHKEKKGKIKNETNYQFLQNLKASIWTIDELLRELK